MVVGGGGGHVSGQTVGLIRLRMLLNKVKEIQI